MEASAAAAVTTLEAELRISAEAAAATEASTTAAAAAAAASYDAEMQRGAEDKNTCLAQLQVGTTSCSSPWTLHAAPPPPHPHRVLVHARLLHIIHVIPSAPSSTLSCHPSRFKPSS